MNKLIDTILIVIIFVTLIASCHTISKYDSKNTKDVAKVISKGIY